MQEAGGLARETGSRFKCGDAADDAAGPPKDLVRMRKSIGPASARLHIVLRPARLMNFQRGKLGQHGAIPAILARLVSIPCTTSGARPA